MGIKLSRSKLCHLKLVIKLIELLIKVKQLSFERKMIF
jgi:hypothetical protein